jgi:hypothetical protein
MKSNINIYTEEELILLPSKLFILHTDSYEVNYSDLKQPKNKGVLILYGPNEFCHIEVAKKARKVLKSKNIYIDSVNYI